MSSCFRFAASRSANPGRLVSGSVCHRLGFSHCRYLPWGRFVHLARAAFRALRFLCSGVMSADCFRAPLRPIREKYVLSFLSTLRLIRTSKKTTVPAIGQQLVYVPIRRNPLVSNFRS